MRQPRNLWWVLLLAALMTACGQANAVTLAPESAMPDFLHDADMSTRMAYRYAMANPGELEKYPCYCGCANIGHLNNRDCYISEIGANGDVTFDSHAAGCGVCVDITQDVIRLKNQGWTSPQIRSYVDSHYNQFGPGTNTPLPLE